MTNKKITTKKIENLISYYQADVDDAISAYVRTDDIKELAYNLLYANQKKEYKKLEYEEQDEYLEDIIKDIFESICSYLEEYEYIETEFQGDYYRHIWHKEKKINMEEEKNTFSIFW